MLRSINFWSFITIQYKKIIVNTLVLAMCIILSAIPVVLFAIIGTITSTKANQSQAPEVSVVARTVDPHILGQKSIDGLRESSKNMQSTTRMNVQQEQIKKLVNDPNLPWVIIFGGKEWLFTYMISVMQFEKKTKDSMD